MESEEDKRGSSDNEEGISGSESVEGSDADAVEVEPEVAAARHNYNPRSKRGVSVEIEEPMHVKKNKIAPGVGVVADRYHVGGRDRRASCRPYGMSTDSESSDVERSDTDRGEREVKVANRVVRPVLRRSLSRLMASPVTGTKGRVRHWDVVAWRRL